MELCSVKSSTSDRISYISWFFYHFCLMVILIEPCHRTHQQKEDIQELIDRVKYVWSECDSILYELDNFKRTIELNEVTFSPLNLFALNRSLAVKVVGCALTYLIVMSQFKLMFYI
ncbi:uncharacterized protein LOC119834727 [Zerene cesonia]|uniref:uncharacterized protein LOC119834727 n=1 Tax=Zerene cesonia TaxID=33412 RepID=UPI0018E50AC1|nr:uncharacterized protein LOC119834727 [Zerene cesonia]